MVFRVSLLESEKYVVNVIEHKILLISKFLTEIFMLVESNVSECRHIRVYL